MVAGRGLIHGGELFQQTTRPGCNKQWDRTRELKRHRNILALLRSCLVTSFFVFADATVFAGKTDSIYICRYTYSYGYCDIAYVYTTMWRGNFGEMKLKISYGWWFSTDISRTNVYTMVHASFTINHDIVK